MTADTTEAQAIIETARLSTTPHHVQAGQLYVVQGAHGHTVVDLTTDRYRDTPRRKQGTVTVADVASFAVYHGKHSDPESEVYADLDRATITAVLDAHHGDPGAARWQAHRLVLALKPAAAWTAWTAHDGHMLAQQAFAEFLEDHQRDVAPDGPVTGADLLEIAQQFQAHTKVSFASGSRLASGETQFTYTEETTASSGRRGTISIPSVFELGLPIFEDLDSYRVHARFRYRISDGRLTLGYRLDNAEDLQRDAVKQVVAKTAEATGAVIMCGIPAPA